MGQAAEAARRPSLVARSIFRLLAAEPATQHRVIIPEAPEVAAVVKVLTVVEASADQTEATVAALTAEQARVRPRVNSGRLVAIFMLPAAAAVRGTSRAVWAAQAAVDAAMAMQALLRRARRIQAAVAAVAQIFRRHPAVPAY